MAEEDRNRNHIHISAEEVVVEVVDHNRISAGVVVEVGAVVHNDLCHRSRKYICL